MNRVIVYFESLQSVCIFILYTLIRIISSPSSSSRITRCSLCFASHHAVVCYVCTFFALFRSSFSANVHCARSGESWCACEFRCIYLANTHQNIFFLICELGTFIWTRRAVCTNFFVVVHRFSFVHHTHAHNSNFILLFLFFFVFFSTIIIREK